MTDPARVPRSRPLWATVVATLGLLVCGFPAYGGLVLVWQDAVRQGEWLDGVGFTFGGLLLAAVLLVAGPLVVYLVRGGSRLLWWSLAGVAVVAWGWFVLGVLPEL